jgi:hypothetical protein
METRAGDGPEGQKAYQATPHFEFELKEVKEEEEKAQKEAQAKEEVVQVEEAALKQEDEQQHAEADSSDDDDDEDNQAKLVRPTLPDMFKLLLTCEVLNPCAAAWR